MKFLCALCVLCGLVLPALALDREAFTFTHYDLNARIEPQQQRLGVRGKITLRNDSDSPQKTAVLQISSTLNWSAVRIDGNPVEFVTQQYTSDIDHTGALSEAVVVLPRPVAPKQSIDLEIGYEGVIPQDATRLTRIGVPADVAKHSDWDQIGRWFTALRGIGYVAWYPIATEAANLSEPSSVSEAVGRWNERERNSEMRVVFAHTNSEGIRPSLYCDARGQVLASEEMGRAYSSQSECWFESLNSTVPFFLIADYQALDRAAVNICYLAQHKSNADDYAVAVDQVAPFVDRWFSDHRPRPEMKAEVLELPDPDASPFASGNVLLTPLALNDTALLLSALRQLTQVTFPSPRSWIFDGLPLFAQSAYMDHEKGRAAAIAYMENHRSALLESEKNAGKRDQAAQHSLINSVDEFYVDAKAMSVWWMLRDMVGENALIAALHSYRAGNDSRADYMQKLIEAQAHRDLSWFFDDWVYRDRGLPDFRIDSVYPRQLAVGGYMVTVTIENFGTAAAEVPVTLKMAATEASDKLVVPANSTASIRIQTPAMPLEAVVNDGSVPETNVSNNTFRLSSETK
jgi:hypothetical protein